MSITDHIKFGDGLTVIDEGAGVIRVNAGGGGGGGGGLPVPPWTVDFDTGVVTGDTTVSGGVHTGVPLTVATAGEGPVGLLLASAFSASTTSGSAEALDAQATAIGSDGATGVGVTSNGADGTIYGVLAGASTSGTGVAIGGSFSGSGAVGDSSGNFPIGVEVSATAESGYALGLRLSSSSFDAAADGAAIEADAVGSGVAKGVVSIANSETGAALALVGEANQSGASGGGQCIAVEGVAIGNSNGNAVRSPIGGYFQAIDQNATKHAVGVEATSSDIGVLVHGGTVGIKLTNVSGDAACIQFVGYVSGINTPPSSVSGSGILFVETTGGTSHLKIAMNGTVTTIV